MTRIARVAMISIALAVVAVFPPQAVEAQGCPWCTTPTTCEPINEPTPLSACWIGLGGVCNETEGKCEPGGTLRHAVAILDVDDRDVETVTDRDFGRVQTVPVGNGVYVAWNCQGEAIAVYARSADGRMAKIPGPIDPRYDFSRVVRTREDPHALVP